MYDLLFSHQTTLVALGLLKSKMTSHKPQILSLEY